MKAAEIYRYGGSEVGEINQTAPLPSKPLPDKIIVGIKTAVVNPVGLEDSVKHIQQMIHLHFPSTLGMDFSRVISQAVHDGETEQKKICRL